MRTIYHAASQGLVLASLAWCAGCADDEVARKSSSATADELGQVEALVIAPDDLVDAFEPYADWKCQRGISTAVVALSYALGATSGPDDAARLRTYLAEQAALGSLRYVVLAGDADVLPVRHVDTEFENELEGYLHTGRLATDLYFADLDGDWDPDADGVYGELEDPADLLPDVAVGRIPVATTAEASAYVAKLIRYESTPKGDYEDRVLLGAAYAGEGAFSSFALEHYVSGELPEDVPRTRLYEDAQQYSGAQMLTRESMLQAFEAGHSIAFMMGHGNEDSMGALSTLDIIGMQNQQRPSVFVTCECLGGRFDAPDADTAGEEFVKGEAGGVAYIGSTDLGIGFPSLSLLMRDLTRCLFEDRLEARSLGGCLQSAQHTYASPDSLHVYSHPDRWSQFGTVLLGDPSVAIWTSRPRVVAMTVASVGGCDTAEVTVSEEGAPVADVVVTAYLPGHFLHKATTNEAGKAVLVRNDCSLQQATFTASGRNIAPVQMGM